MRFDSIRSAAASRISTTSAFVLLAGFAAIARRSSTIVGIVSPIQVVTVELRTQPVPRLLLPALIEDGQRVGQQLHGLCAVGVTGRERALDSRRRLLVLPSSADAVSRSCPVG